MNWTRFLRALFAYVLGIGLLVYLFILLIDPYQDVPFSPDLDRAPVSTNQRFAYPALARNPAFDSAVIGTSTLRLLQPGRLDTLLGTHFVNLAMNSATAYEQSRIHEVFMRHHPESKLLIFGIDLSWCTRGDEIEKYTFREFPQWMYDDNRWNDLLYLFNDKALENAVRMVEYLDGAREAKYDKNGFRDLDKDFGRYDIDKTRRSLYKNAPGGLRPEYDVPDLSPTRAHPEWRFASHELMRRMLERTPDVTTKIILFVPFHGYLLHTSGEVFAECKGRIVDRVGATPNTFIMDYMIDSTITADDRHYWDALHATTPVARQMEHDIAHLVRGSGPAAAAYRVLGRRVTAHAE